MYIIDKRISINYCVEIVIENSNCCINQKDIEYWFSPFFCIQENNINKYNICSKIIAESGIHKDYIYQNNIFYVNSDITYTRILYIIMSIVRMVYKYIAFLMGYHNLHCACLKYMDKGILIAAKRNQGKTTLILNAIQDKAFLLLANDQVMFNANEKKQLLGYPAAVGVRNNSCNFDQQEEINKRALWFIDDPYQNQHKPIIHIKDLSQIFQCGIVDNAGLNTVIYYEKSRNKDELVIEDMGRLEFPINELELPFEKTYKKNLLESCKCSIQYYLNDFCNKKEGLPPIIRFCVDQLNVKCGIDRIQDMLCEVKQILNEKSKSGN